MYNFINKQKLKRKNYNKSIYSKLASNLRKRELFRLLLSSKTIYYKPYDTPPNAKMIPICSFGSSKCFKISPTRKIYPV